VFPQHQSDTPKSGKTWVIIQVRALHAVDFLFRFLLIPSFLDLGMEKIGGERKYVRHIRFTDVGVETKELRVVYDYGM